MSQRSWEKVKSFESVASFRKPTNNEEKLEYRKFVKTGRLTAPVRE